MEIQPNYPIYASNVTERGLLEYAALATDFKGGPKDALDSLILSALRIDENEALSAQYDQLEHRPFNPIGKGYQFSSAVL
jgi:hypothetical protein